MAQTLLRFKEQLHKKPVHDAEGAAIGHVNDLAFMFGQAQPAVTAVAVHMPWTERVGQYRLVRPVDDLVVLFPWARVASFNDEKLLLDVPAAELNIVSADNVLLLRQDVIDKQIVDDEGNRLQRVDDVILSRKGSTLRVELLYLGMTWLPTSVHLKELLQSLTHKAKAAEEVDEIPWQLVGDVDRESDVLTLKPLD